MGGKDFTGQKTRNSENLKFLIFFKIFMGIIKKGIDKMNIRLYNTLR